MNKISPSKILFIKLGEGGRYEKDCIEQSNVLRLGYHEVDHEWTMEGNWKKVYDYYINVEKAKPQTATSHTNQLKQFYTENEQTLWVTFYANKMWWCFSQPIITLIEDKSKTRPVIGAWSDKDIKGNMLLAGNLSGKLLKTQGYRGTICSVLENKYCLSKINGEQTPEVLDVEKGMNDLQDKVSRLVQHLHWRDFETLVDLIFRQAGWQRVSDVGKTVKTIDFDLISPVTGERAIVQVKSQSSLKEFQDYTLKLLDMDNYDQRFYVVHTSDNALTKYDNTSSVKLYHADKVAELVINSGLVDWLIRKTS